MQEDHDAPKPREQGPPSGVIFLSVLLFVVWLIINASFEVPILIVGAAVSVALAFIFVRRSTVWNIPVTPARVFHFIAYTGVFLVELVKANIEMLRYVYAPRIDIRPGIVKVKMPLKTPLGRLALANSIALTPGSLVMDLQGDDLYIHWLDVKTTDPEEAARAITGPFQKHLEAVFG
jgi:multicomponent Na+:H+ antiporter subunit E